MQRRDFLKSSAALAALVALREEAIAAPGDIPHRTLGRTGQSVSIIGIGGYHIGRPDVSETRSHPHHPHGDRLAASTSSTTAGTTTTATARAAWARRSRRLPPEGLPDDQDRRPHQASRRQSSSTSRSGACRPTTSTWCRSTRSSARTIPSASSPPAAPSRRWWRRKKAGKIRFIGFTGHKRPARSTCTCCDGRDAARLHASTPCRCRST